MRLTSTFSLILMICFLSCQNDDQPKDNSSSRHTSRTANTHFQKLDPKKTNVDFVNRVVDGKDFNVLTYRNFYNGGGVGIGDINNDGLLDLFFTSNMESNRLYLNKGNFEFEDISEAAGIAGKRGWSTGISMVDVNADGYLDLYVSNSGDIEGDDRENELYINNGDLTFTEKAQEYNLANPGYSTHASFFDYDQDGDLDCYILNNSFRDPNKISSFSKTREEDDELGGDRLMRNDNGTYVDVSKQAGIYTSAIGFGLGISVSDLNQDHLPDMYISNDFWERDYIYINQGDGTFSEELADRVSICSVSSMGSDVGDLNNDGYPEIFTTDMLAADNYRLKAMTMFDPYFLENYKYRSSYHYQILQNCLQYNDGNGVFQETASLSGVSATDWSWGALLFDFDNNGWKDIYVSNGIYRDIMDQDFTNFLADKDEVKNIVLEKGEFDFRDFLPFLPSTPIHNYAFVNQQNQKFNNEAQTLGFTDAEFSNGAAYGDLDNDGDLDLVLNNVNMPASIYKNELASSNQHYLKVELRDPESKNHYGVGAIVKLKIGKEVLVHQHYMNRGFQSSVAPGVFMGLGDTELIDEVEVVWPDQKIDRIQNVNVDQSITITKGSNTAAGINSPVSKAEENNFIQKINNVVGAESKHMEDVFNDFDRERLLFRMHSTEGPRLAKGDLDGDGLEDIVTLGATGDSDKIFRQNQNGTFDLTSSSALEADKEFESTCSALFDRDGDGDLDLVIGSGGNDFSKGMDGYLIRYYENDGKGSFEKVEEKTPPAGGQFSVILPTDFDQDGDLDLFIGARSIPGNYGLIPRSFLLRNDGNTWKDITDQSLGQVGMITDASWLDTDSDGDQDLIVVGEWMPVTLFENNGTTLIQSGTVKNSNGWWLDMEPTDIDKDGDTDFVLGNWGLNSKFKATAALPLELHVKDFDDNGKSEFILNWKPPSEERIYPFHTKMDLTEQLPSLKKKFLKYADYARSDYNQLFSANERKGAKSYEVSTLHTSILRNEGGRFILEELPVAAQVAPVFASTIEDFNKDGRNDIWLAGNFYGLKPEVGRLDASKGILLLGQEDHSYIQSSLTTNVTGEVRDVVKMKIKDKNILMVSRNNDTITTLTYQ